MTSDGPLRATESQDPGSPRGTGTTQRRTQPRTSRGTGRGKGATPRRGQHEGRPYRRARAQMFALYGTVCHLCGHEGAGEADHLVPLAVDSTQPVDPHTMRPAHGIRSRCPSCPGRPACNQSRGTKPLASTFRPKLTW